LESAESTGTHPYGPPPPTGKRTRCLCDDGRLSDPVVSLGIEGRL
jgi:hypothetical protein